MKKSLLLRAGKKRKKGGKKPMVSGGNKRMREQDTVGQLVTEAHYIPCALFPDALHFSMCSQFPTPSLEGLKISASVHNTVFGKNNKEI